MLNTQRENVISSMMNSRKTLQPPTVPTSEVEFSKEEVAAYIPFLKIINPHNPKTIRPKKLNQAQYQRLIEEIYTFKFDPKSMMTQTKTQMSAKTLPSAGLLGRTSLASLHSSKVRGTRDSEVHEDLESKSLQEAAAKYLILKNKSKLKIDQAAMDLLTSIEYHRKISVEADLFHRFMTEQYSEQDLTFYLFERSLAERELHLKLTQMPNNFDIRN